MWRGRVIYTFIATCSLLAAGCVSVPGDSRQQLVNLPLASTYADASFTLSNVSLSNLLCSGGESECPGAGDAFSEQVRRVAGRLQEGARRLYPDLAQRIPNVASGQFEVFVTAAEDVGSASTADGRIALNGGLARQSPDDAWLAFVIAREMGHVIARHPEERSLLSMATSVVLNIAIPGSGLLKSALSTVGSALAARSKEASQAREADAIALRLLRESGYPLRDVAHSLESARPLNDNNAWSRHFTNATGSLHAAAQAEARAARPAREATERTRLAARSLDPELLAAERPSLPVSAR